MDPFSKTGILLTGTWRALSEHFAPCTATSVTELEKFTPRNKQVEIAVIVALLMGGMKQVLSKIVRSFYPVTSPTKEAAAGAPQAQYGTFAGLTAPCWQPDAFCNLL